MTEYDRSILAVYFAYAFQSMGQAISWQFVTYFLRHDLGVDSYILMTLVWSLPALVVMGTVNIWGSISDKTGRRRPFMILGFIGYSLTFLLYSFVTDWIQYFAIALVGAAFYSAAVPMGQAYLTSRTENKGERLGFLLVAMSGGWFFGALSSGLLYDTVGMFQLYRFAALLCVVATGICTFFVSDAPVVEEEVSHRISFRELLARPGMIRVTIAATFSAIGINSIAYVMAILIVDELGGLTAYVGFANSGATLLAVLFTGYVGKVIDRKGPIGVLIMAYLSYCIFAVGFALAADPITATILYALPVYPLASTAAYSLAALVSGESERGRAMGLINGGQNAGAALGPIIGGLFAEYWFGRVQPISWLTFLFNFFALILAVTLIKIGRDLHEKETEESEGLPVSSSHSIDE